MQYMVMKSIIKNIKYHNLREGIKLKFKYKNINIGSILVTWLLSYMSILMIPLLINGLVYVKSSMILQEEINKANLGMLKQYQSSIDSRLREVEFIAQQISFNPNIISLKSVNENLDQFQEYNIYKATQDLKVYQLANGFIDDVYVFIKQSKTILTSSNHLDSELAYQYFYRYNNISYDEWIKLLNNTHKGDLVALKVSDGANGFNQQIAYIQSLPVESPSDSFATLVIPINIKRFQDAIQNINSVNQGVSMIIDKDNHVIVNTPGIKTLTGIPYKKLTGSSGIIHQTVNGKKVVISYMSSQVFDWKYVTVVPIEVFLDKIKYIQLLNRISLILCILLGGMVSFFFLRKNYIPINNIVKRLKGREGKSLNKKSNEYGFIMDAISASFDENDKINKRLEVQNKEVRASFFRRILRGQLRSNISLNDSLTSFGINLLSDNFTVLLFNIEDNNEPSLNQNIIEDEAKFENSSFILVNVIEELANQNNQGYMVEVDEKMYACLINLKQQEEANVRIEMFRIANEAQKFIQETFKVNFTVSISNVHSTIIGISEAYQEANEVMEYKNVVGYSEIMHYDEMVNTKYPKNSYFYPLETEYQLINSIKVGELEKAKSIVNNVFDINFSSKSISLKITKCFMFNMISTMVKALDEINNIYNDNLLEELNSIDRLLECKTTSEMKSTLINIIGSVCNYVSSKKKSGHKELIKNIVVFVENNYTDMNFSISMIGENFKMTPSYISKIYMEETGEGLLDFININRLEKAKQLLKEKKLSVNEITYAVGFSNSGTFIRAFKKYEGITPGKY